MRAIDPHLHDKFTPKGLDWRTTRHTKYISFNLMVLKIFCFTHYKSMGVIDPQGVASQDSRESMLWSTRCC